jgi:hypothetical protein
MQDLKALGIIEGFCRQQMAAGNVDFTTQKVRS